MKIRFTPFLFVLLVFAAACGKPEKESKTVVIDSVNVLTERQWQALSTEIQELEDSMGSQIRILIIKSLKGQSIEAYSLHVAETYQLGRKDFNDGILITVSLDDRKMRIEVGTGLENIIKDEIAGQIIQDQMAPDFREARYYEGLSKAIQQIKTLLKTNQSRIGENPESGTIANETPTLDTYLVESLPDTAVQELSGAFALLVMPDETQIDQLVKEYGEEDLSTIMDDASFYQSEATNLMDSLGIKTVNAEKRFIRYRNVIREWNLDLYKTNSPWFIIFFDPDQRPKVVSSIEVDEENIKAYFKTGHTDIP